MNAVGYFTISYLVAEISTFEELQHYTTTTTTTATVKIVTSLGLPFDQ